MAAERLLVRRFVDGHAGTEAGVFAAGQGTELSLLYWMQTEAPRPDGKQGWKGLRLRKDVVGTEDGLAKAAYIRESRRIKAEFTILEQHVGTDMRATSESAANGGAF